MIKRNAADLLKKLAVGFPVVSITGPRQNGGEQAQQRTIAQVVPWRNLAGLLQN